MIMGIHERIPMKRLLLALTLMVVFSGNSAPAADADPSPFTPLLDLRLRQEYLDNVLYFAPDPDRNLLRLRPRVGLNWEKDKSTIQLRLANECRYYLHPDGLDMDWNELIIDQLFWQYRPQDTKLTVGRQNIIWDDGFIMLESSPYDGSRTIYHDAIRWQKTYGTRNLDLSVIYNGKYDHLVLAGDKDVRMRDADEFGVALRYETAPSSFSYIFKQDKDPDHVLPDLTTHTLDARTSLGSKQGLHWMGEISGQYLIWEEGYLDDRTQLGLALQTILEFNLSEPTTRGEVGFFLYDKWYRTPWGRWPKWSELFIYTLIGESTPGRVNVAAWENTAAPFVGVKGRFSNVFTGKARAMYLLAPSPDWQARGLLLQAKLEIRASSHWSGHLLWEMLDPGTYLEEHQPAMTETANFLRWEIIFKL